MVHGHTKQLVDSLSREKFLLKKRWKYRFPVLFSEITFRGALETNVLSVIFPTQSLKLQFVHVAIHDCENYANSSVGVKMSAQAFVKQQNRSLPPREVCTYLATE